MTTPFKENIIFHIYANIFEIIRDIKKINTKYYGFNNLQYDKKL